MVCGNGCKASVVGRWEGVKRCLIPWREKELCCNCHATRGRDSRWQIQSAVGTLVFRWASDWRGRASSRRGNFPERQNPETKWCSQSNQLGQRCRPPRLPLLHHQRHHIFSAWLNTQRNASYVARVFKSSLILLCNWGWQGGIEMSVAERWLFLPSSVWSHLWTWTCWEKSLN